MLATEGTLEWLDGEINSPCQCLHVSAGKLLFCLRDPSRWPSQHCVRMMVRPNTPAAVLKIAASSWDDAIYRYVIYLSCYYSARKTCAVARR